MSDNENKPRILRTSAGKTRLTAESADTGQSQSGAAENKQASGAGSGQPAKPQQPAQSQQATQSQTRAQAGSAGQAEKPQQAGQPAKATQPEKPAKPAQAPAGVTDSASGNAQNASDAKTSDASKPKSSGVRSTSQGVRLGGSKSDAGQTQVVATSGGAGSGGTGGAGASSSGGAGSTGGGAAGRGSEAPTQQGSGPDTSRDRGGESQPSSQTQRGSAPTQVGGVGAAAGAGAGASAAGGAATSAANQTGSGPDHSNVAKTSGAKKSKDGVRASSAGVKMKGNKKSGPRSVNLTVASVDLWSVSKMTLLLSVALGIATIVAFIILWLVLQATGTLESIRGTLGEIAGPESAEEMLKLLGFGPVVSFAVILAVVNVVLMTALATLFGFLYNIGAKMVGGFRLTLVDD